MHLQVVFRVSSIFVFIVPVIKYKEKDKHCVLSFFYEKLIIFSQIVIFINSICTSLVFKNCQCFVTDFFGEIYVDTTKTFIDLQ